MAGGVDAKTRDNAEYITTKHSARPWQETRYRLENVLVDRMLAPSDRSKAAGDRQHEDNVKFATALLNASTKDHRYYMLCQLPVDPADRREMEEGLRQLSGRFPALVILAVMDDMATKLNEITEHEPLRYVLP